MTLPFPPELLPTGCAVETTRHPATFEAALDGEPTLEELCAVVGPPDWVTGSGLLIVVYDLDDGGQLLAGHGGIGGPLMGAQWLGRNGERRLLAGG